MWGLKPGPLLFTENPDFVWGLISSMYVGNIICLLIGIATIPFMIHILKVPTSIMIPVVAGICVISAYCNGNNMFDVWFMVGVGVIAYLLSKANYPMAPILLAFVLTPTFEKKVTQALNISNGSFSIFWTSPIALVILILTVLFVLLPVLFKIIEKKKQSH